jgi:CRISPR-associated protein Csm3
VPEGTKFDFTISLKVFDDDANDNLEEKMLQGLALLEMDALGGSGSRGYGRVEFTFDDANMGKEFNKVKERLFSIGQEMEENNKKGND